MSACPTCGRVTAPRLGWRQRHIISCMKARGGRAPQTLQIWTWGGRSKTRSVLGRLLELGLVEQDSYCDWWLTELGWAVPPQERASGD